MSKVHQILNVNVGGVVVDQLLFKFLLCRSIPELFALKFESCQKSRRIMDVFRLPQFCWRHPFKKLYHVITHASRLVLSTGLVGITSQKFCEVIPSNPAVIGTQMLNFNVRLKIFWGPIPVWVCASKPIGQSLARVKI